MKKVVLSLALILILATFLAFASAAAPYVAYWGFEGSAGEEINGYTPSNAASFPSVSGKNGTAYGGAGTDASGIMKYDSVNVPLGESFTCAVWAKGDYNVEAGSYYVMMAKNPKATDGHFEFYWNPNGQFSVYATNTDMVCLLESSNPMDDGQWHHYVIICEKGQWKLYVDGKADVTYDGSVLNFAEGPLFLGGLVDNTLPCQSSLDDLFFTDSVISEADIPSLMSDTKAYAYKIAGKDAAAPAAVPAEETAAAPAETAAPADTAVPVAAPQTFDTAFAEVAAIVGALSVAVVITCKSKRKEF